MVVVVAAAAAHHLLPLDHAVARVVEDDDDDVQLHPHRRLELLGIHHEAAVAAERDALARRLDHLGGECGVRRGNVGSDEGMWGRAWDRSHLGGDRGGEAGAHRRQRVVEQHGVGLEGGVRARDVDLVHAVVEAEDRRRLQRAGGGGGGEVAAAAAAVVVVVVVVVVVAVVVANHSLDSMFYRYKYLHRS